MKLIVILLLIFTASSATIQDYPFNKDFVNGTIFFKASTQKAGQVKCFLSQNEKLKFRENEKAETVKYSPDDIAGFAADTIHFALLSSFIAIAESYGLAGKTTEIKHIFGQVIAQRQVSYLPCLYYRLQCACRRHPNLCEFRV